MNQSRSHIYDRLSHDFHTYGLDGTALNRTAELRASEQYQNEVSVSLRPGVTRVSFRRYLGELLITAGRSLTGTELTPPALPAPPEARINTVM